MEMNGQILESEIHQLPSQAGLPPLCIDLDGTLVRTDTLWELAVALLKEHPWQVLCLPLWLMRGKARLKEKLAKAAKLDYANLPYTTELLTYLRQAHASGRELILVSPYLVPGESEMALIRRLRERGVRVRILTNSLASTDMPIVHVGYMRYRIPLLEAGCELYEVRPELGKPESGHGLIKSGGSSQFGLHAKVFVIDNQRAFVGSMNFDQR